MPKSPNGSIHPQRKRAPPRRARPRHPTAARQMAAPALDMSFVPPQEREHIRQLWMTVISW